jgi:hypothetical protein
MRPYQTLVTGLTVCVAALLLTRIPQLSAVPADLDRRLEATWLGVTYAVYAGALALFVVWKVGHKREGQTLGLLLAVAGVMYAVTITPTGEAGPVGRWAITATVAALFPANLLFWATFPQPMRLADVKALDAGTGKRTWFGQVNRLSSWVVVKMFENRVARAIYGVLVLVFAYKIAEPGSYQYNVFLRTSSVANEPLLNGCGFPALLVGFAFTWTSFRLADARQMRRLLWVALAAVITALWVTLAVSLGLVAGFSHLEVIKTAAPIVAATYAPFTAAINLTGVALAIFYHGALDLRPVINKTTAYSLMFITLTVLFAGVEEAVQSLLTARLGIANGIGSWIGAGVVAVAFGPIHSKIDTTLKRVGRALEG